MTIKSVAIGSDHAGFELKEMIKSHLEKKGYVVEDYGTYSLDSVDYPNFAHPVAQSVESGMHKEGILICGSAQGVCMTANKHQGVRASIAWMSEIAALSKQHNDANVVCLPARFVNEDEAKEIVDVFLGTAFEGGRHERRVNKISVQ